MTKARHGRHLIGCIAVVLTLPSAASGQTKAALHDAMRKLWTDHVAWTRLFIISAAAGLPDKDATTQRLLQNQTDIGNAVGEYYGKPAGAKLHPVELGNVGQMLLTFVREHHENPPTVFAVPEALQQAVKLSCSPVRR